MTFFSKEKIDKSFTAMYAPWAAISVILIISGITLVNYFHSKYEEKTIRAEEIIKEYSGTHSYKESLSTIHTRLISLGSEKLFEYLSKSRCSYLSKIRKHVTFEKCLDRSSYNSSSLDLNEFERAQLREILKDNQIEYFDQYLGADNKINLGKLIDFYERVVSCVDTERCSRDIIVSRFSKDFIALTNTYCIYFGEEAKIYGVSGKARDDFIVKFVIAQLDPQRIISSSNDQNRKRIFRCERHRSLEEASKS